MRNALCRAVLAVALACGSATIARTAQSTAAPHDAVLAEATSALQSGALDRASTLATAYLKRHPASTAADVLIARIGIARGDLDAAYTALQRALEKDPRNVDALYYLGLVTARLSQASFEELQRSAPDSARVHQLLAEGLEAQDHRAAAATEYEAALARQPDLLDALLGLARLKRIQLACDEAVPLYQKAERLHSTFDGAYGLGVCQSLLQDDESAVPTFERAIKLDPRAAIAWMSLGESLTKLRRPADAIARLQRAIELEPRLGEAYYALGMAYQASGQQALAQEAFKNAERLGGAVGVSHDAPAPSPPGPR